MDTNALSAIADGLPALEKIIAGAPEIALPVIVLGEYRYGIRQSRDQEAYRQWLSDFIPSCRILDVTEDTTESYAVIRSELKRAGTPIPTNDIWIAALSRQHSLPLLSRDTHFDVIRGFQRVAW